MSGTKAIVETNNGGTNNVVDFTYREEGVDGNRIPIQIIAPTVAGQVLAIDYGKTLAGAITISPASTDGSTVTTTGTQLVLAFNGVKASNTLTSNNSNPSDGDTITIGGQTYRFKTTTAAINDILIGVSADATLTSLINVLNGVATIAASGADAFTGTKNGNSQVSAAAVSAHASVISARWAGTAYNGIATPVAGVGTTLTWTATTFGGATAGVEPLDKKSSQLFTAAANGTITGILAAGVFTFGSTGSTAGAGTAYDSITTAMAAGWVFSDPVGSAVVVATPDNLHLPTADHTFYQAALYGSKQGGQHTVQADSAAHLLTALKSFAIQKASRGEARDWSPQQYYAPTIYSS